jgi:hypothetical protein
MAFLFRQSSEMKRAVQRPKKMTEEEDAMGLSIRARFLGGIKASKRLRRIGRDIYVVD